jgi:POT family proton-dependent oligopeptide transporter
LNDEEDKMNALDKDYDEDPTLRRASVKGDRTVGLHHGQGEKV